MRNAPYAKSDQAEGLRRLCGRQSRQLVSVAAATSGAGRTAFILHVAVALATLGRRVLIIDENKGLGNVNDVLGLGLRYDLAHAIAGDRDMREICRPALVGIKLLPMPTWCWSTPPLRAPADAGHCTVSTVTSSWYRQARRR